jgi:hypothetical protein
MSLLFCKEGVMMVDGYQKRTGGKNEKKKRTNMCKMTHLWGI